jgi:hypothetical protein
VVAHGGKGDLPKHVKSNKHSELSEANRKITNSLTSVKGLSVVKSEGCLLKRLNVTKRSLVFKASLHSKNKYKLVTAQHMKYFWILNRSEFYNNIQTNIPNFQKQIGRLQTL